VKFAPSKADDVCDQCKTALTHRSDDKPEVVKQRLATYREQTEPLIAYYGKKGLVTTVDGEGEPEEVFENLLKALKVPA
ncbi:MAG: nucleoside monophosphate kinase, partial [Cyanobacteria bacterium]|nr:nucleoside monophosphate kinase [Cyanobacteriota bacterium]